jgi:hypothetical protein
MHRIHTPLPNLINLKCLSDRPCYDQTIHQVQVETEDEGNWYGKPLANSNCGILQWPKFAWKEVETQKEDQNAASNRGVVHEITRRLP